MSKAQAINLAMRRYQKSMGTIYRYMTKVDEGIDPGKPLLPQIRIIKFSGRKPYRFSDEHLKIMQALFQKNPSVSYTEIHQALGSPNSPSYSTINRWLKRVRSTIAFFDMEKKS